MPDWPSWRRETPMGHSELNVCLYYCKGCFLFCATLNSEIIFSMNYDECGHSTEEEKGYKPESLVAAH